MSRIGSLVSAGAGTIDLSYLPGFLQIGNIDNSDNITNFNVNARGKTLIELNDANQIQAIFKTEMNLIADGANTAIGQCLVLAEGRIEGQATLNIVNGSATTTAVYGNSFGKAPKASMLARRVATSPIQANQNMLFANFDLLLVDPTNLSRATVQYANEFTEDVSPDELVGIYARQYPVEANGLINGLLPIAGNRGKGFAKIKAITLFAGAGGAVDVVVSNFRSIEA